MSKKTIQARNQNKKQATNRNRLIGGIVVFVIVAGIVGALFLSQNNNGGDKDSTDEKMNADSAYTVLDCPNGGRVFYTNTVMWDEPNGGGNFPVIWTAHSMAVAEERADDNIRPHLSELTAEHGFKGGIVSIHLQPDMQNTILEAPMRDLEGKASAKMMCWLTWSAVEGKLLQLQESEEYQQGFFTADYLTAFYDAGKFGLIEPESRKVIQDFLNHITGNKVEIAYWDWTQEPTAEVIQMARELDENNIIVNDGLQWRHLFWNKLEVIFAE